MEEKTLNLIPMLPVIEESKCDTNKNFKSIQDSLIRNTIKRKEPYHTLSENIITLLNGTGIATKELTAKETFIKLLPLIPFVQGSTHLWQYGRPALGKTFLFSKVLASSSKTISGKITGAQLFGDIKKGEEGLVAEHDVIGLEDSQSFNFTAEEKGSILDFLSTGETRMKNIGSTKVYSTSFVFNGNFEDNTEQELQEAPYNNVKELLNSSFPEGFNQNNFKSRVICVPTWILRNAILIEDNDTLGYEINFFLDNLKKLKEKKLSLSYKVKLENPRSEDNLNKFVTGMYKLLNFSQLVLGVAPITTNLDIEALNFIGKKIVELPFSNSKFTLVGPKEVNQFWIKLSEHLMKYPLTSITEAYVSEHRITVRFKEEKKSLYKIALDNIGIEQNKAEVEIYQNIPGMYSELLIPIYPYHKDYLSVVAKTENSPFSSYQRINDVESIFQQDISLDSLNLDTPQLIEYLKSREESHNQEIENLKNHLELLNSFIINNFSSDERMASKNAPLTSDEKESLTYDLIDCLAESFSLQREIFKNYHFVLDEKERRTYLLHYYYLKDSLFQ